jgi:A/G-specific adenine glycosylase
MNAHFRRKVIWAGYKLARHKIVTGENLPWRQQRTPYRIFLAEMLLVRTRADVVTRIYEDVFGQYPDIYKLAEANEDELREALHPLGLSKRIPYIIKAARHICEIHNGQIPNNIDSLLKTPGLGMYTAPAIATFAHGQTFVPGDVNILRFVARLTGLEMEHKTKGSKQLRELAPLLSENCTGLSTEKLLDFTRLICRSRNPLCEQCPLTRHCIYFREGKQ